MSGKRPLSLSLPTTYRASRKVSFLDRNVPNDPNNVSSFGAKRDTSFRHFRRFLRVILHDRLASGPQRYSIHYCFSLNQALNRLDSLFLFQLAKRDGKTLIHQPHLSRDSWRQRACSLIAFALRARTKWGHFPERIRSQHRCWCLPGCASPQSGAPYVPQGVRALQSRCRTLRRQRDPHARSAFLYRYSSNAHLRRSAISTKRPFAFG